MNSENKSLKEKAKFLKTTMQIGKSGLTEEIIKELNLQLRKKGLIKIKIARSYIEDKDKKEVVKEITTLTESKMIEMRGFVLTIHKKIPSL